MTDEHDGPETIESTDGYTRIKGKIQRGDGPDARGEVTVELVRGVDHPDHDSMFGEYALEADRAVKHLRKTLELDDGDGEVSG